LTALADKAAELLQTVSNKHHAIPPRLWQQRPSRWNRPMSVRRISVRNTLVDL